MLKYSSVSKFIYQSIQKKSSDRFESAEEMKGILETVADELAVPLDESDWLRNRETKARSLIQKVSQMAIEEIFSAAKTT